MLSCMALAVMPRPNEGSQCWSADRAPSRAKTELSHVVVLQLYFGKTIEQGSVDLVPDAAQLAY